MKALSQSTLVLRSLRFHWRSHMVVLLGTAVATAILVGALLVGECVRDTLRERALGRLGATSLALVGGDRHFHAALADEVGKDLKARAVAVLVLEGSASCREASAPGVQVLGVDARFWDLGPGGAPVEPIAPGEVLLNQALAGELGAAPGQMVELRMAKPSALPPDWPLSSPKDSMLILRLKVVGVVSARQFGDFGLRADQAAPFNAMVSLSYLGQELGLPGQANVMLVSRCDDPSDAMESLRRNWQLADAQVETRPAVGGEIELWTPRVFLSPAVSSCVTAASPDRAYGVLTYFVNEIRLGSRTTPYCMVCALGSPPGGDAATHSNTARGLARILQDILPPAGGQPLADDQIVINDWLASDLRARPGDLLDVAYTVLGPDRRFAERTSRFRVRGIVPMRGLAADRDLMPQFPGLANVEDCRDWKAGIDIDPRKIRKQDRDYWDAYRGTPKAFVTLRAGRRMWANPFGDLTAIRLPASDRHAVESSILHKLDPAATGLGFQPVRKRALEAAAQSLDFGQLFLGFSAFLISSALLLMTMVFSLAIRRRSADVGALLSLGLGRRRVRSLLLAEASLPLVAGAVLGAMGGILYTQAMLWGMRTVWSDAFAGLGGQGIVLHVGARSLAIGVAVGAGAALASVWLTLQRQFRSQPRELLSPGAYMGELAILPARWTRWASLLVGQLALALAAALVIWSGGRDHWAPENFFGAGAALLVASLCTCNLLLTSGGRKRHRRGDSQRRLSLTALAYRNATRRPGRSLSTVALLACASFLIVAVDANRQDSVPDASRRDSPTGGFALVGESTLPILGDVDTRRGLGVMGLRADQQAVVSIVPMRLREGDQASCLNLNRAQTPRLLAVRPEELQRRGSFTFLKVTSGSATPQAWSLLEGPAEPDVVPAVGDQSTITWSLGKKLGDELPYVDEQGRTFRVRLVGMLEDSVLQGSLIVSCRRFEYRFPSLGGWRFFLIDAPDSNAQSIRQAIARALADRGLAVSTTTQRLARFNAVRNTYLSIFQMLGALGLLLGSAGLAIVLLRNVLERRGELAILKAVGLSPWRLRWMVLVEHWGLLALGLVSGGASAALAVLPAIRSHAALPWGALAIALAAVLVGGLLWVALATAAALRGRLTEALRNE